MAWPTRTSSDCLSVDGLKTVADVLRERDEYVRGKGVPMYGGFGQFTSDTYVDLFSFGLAIPNYVKTGDTWRFTCLFRWKSGATGNCAYMKFLDSTGSPGSADTLVVVGSDADPWAIGTATLAIPAGWANTLRTFKVQAKRAVASGIVKWTTANVFAPLRLR